MSNTGYVNEMMRNGVCGNESGNITPRLGQSCSEAPSSLQSRWPPRRCRDHIGHAGSGRGPVAGRSLSCPHPRLRRHRQGGGTWEASDEDGSGEERRSAREGRVVVRDWRDSGRGRATSGAGGVV